LSLSPVKNTAMLATANIANTVHKKSITMFSTKVCYFLNLDTAFFQSAGLNLLTESNATIAIMPKGIKTSII
jgi:hypothetical protein